MISIKKRAATAVPTPAADKVTVFIDDTGAAKTKDSTGTVAALGGGGTQSGTSGLKDFAFADRNSGDIALNSTSWANVDTALDLILTAAVGDVIEVSLSALTSIPSGTELYLDAVSVVAGAPVNSWGTGGTPDAATEGIQAWRVPQNGVLGVPGGTYMRTLVAGDISAGTVTLRLRYREPAAAAITMYASANRRIHWSAKNLGPIPA